MFLILVFYFITKVSEKLFYKAWDPKSVNMNLFWDLPNVKEREKHIVVYHQKLKIQHFSLSFQEKFPTLEERPYPVWIYVIIFILAGIPSIAVPLVALWKYLKKKKSEESHLYNMSDQIQTNNETESPA